MEMIIVVIRKGGDDDSNDKEKVEKTEMMIDYSGDKVFLPHSWSLELIIR